MCTDIQIKRILKIKELVSSLGKTEKMMKAMTWPCPFSHPINITGALSSSTSRLQ